ncbi:MAG: response regulator transcription factor [Pseudomonadota bacterium]
MDTPADAHILIADDDPALAEDLQVFLVSEGYAVSVASNVPEARLLLTSDTPDLCLIDIVMPGTSGKVFCREVVERSDAAAVMMSSLSDEDTIVSMLEIGADDYLVKPFGHREMLARIRAVLRRRAASPRVPQQRHVQVGTWLFDSVDRTMMAPDGFVRSLTPGEAELLRFFTVCPGTVFSREDLLAVSRTRQHAGSVDRSVDNLVKRLRKKVEPDPANPRHIATVWGKGYRFDP